MNHFIMVVYRMKNTRFLQQINEINYSLTYTEGEWFYKDHQNVSSNPLEVISIENQGYLTIGTPIYLSELNQDDVSLDLIPFQEFLNIYYEEDLLEPLRTDGYFDLATKDLLMQFQTEFNLEVNGQLNIETARQIYDLYLSFINDYRFDIQLNRLIEIIKG